MSKVSSKTKTNPYEDGDDAKFIPVHKRHKGMHVQQKLKKGGKKKHGKSAVRKVIIK